MCVVLGLEKVRESRFCTRQILLVAAVWLATRGMMVSELGYWRRGTKVNYEDVFVYQSWASRIMSTHSLPGEPAWQYPPGAIVAFLIPRQFGGNYGAAFVAMILLADIITTVALVVLCMRSGSRLVAVWYWLLGLAALGEVPLVRFDVLPTCFAVVALALATTSPRRFGVIVGVGTAVKAWPVLALLALLERRRAGVAAAFAAATFLVFIAASWLTLDGTFGFLHHQSGRGLELEAVAGTPWYIRQAITGRQTYWIGRNGSLEILSPKADDVAQVLHFALFVLAIAVIAWWIQWLRTRPNDLAMGLDAVFTAVLLFVVVSEVLSPQYMIWLIGMGAVAIASPGTRVRRPVATVAIAMLLTRALMATFGELTSNGANGAYLVTLRNIALVYAAVDASLIMWRALHEDHVGCAPHDVDSTLSA